MPLPISQPNVPPIYQINSSLTVPVFGGVILIGGKFQDVLGNPLANGWLEWKLNHDSNISILGSLGGSQVVAGISVKTYLDGNGNVIPAVLWPNDQLTPEGSYYVVKAFNAHGIEVWAVPQQFVLKGFIPSEVVDVGTLQPQLP